MCQCEDINYLLIDCPFIRGNFWKSRLTLGLYSVVGIVDLWVLRHHRLWVNGFVILVVPGVAVVSMIGNWVYPGAQVLGYWKVRNLGIKVWLWVPCFGRAGGPQWSHRNRST